MNNLKKTATMFLIAAFSISMLLAPFTPLMARDSPQVMAPEITSPEEVMMDLNRYLDQRGLDGPLDSVLAGFKETGALPSDAVVNENGAMNALITLREGADVAAFDEMFNVNWKLDLGVATVVSAYLDQAAVAAIEDFDGVITAFADRLYREATSGVEPRPSYDEVVATEPDAYIINPYIGATAANAAGYAGDGVRVGVVDTGTDFTHPDLVDAVDYGSDGMPTSFDPTGYGFGVTLYRVNATVVNVTEWMGYSSWNMLSYEMDGKWYIDWSTCQHGSPYVNNQGGLSNLDWFVDAYLAAWWGDEYPNQDNLTDYYYDVIRADTEIPAPEYASGSGKINITMNSTSGEWKLVPYYCTGYVFQQRWDPYMKIFSQALVLNGSKIVINWNDTRAHTDFWNLNINWGEFDFNETSTWDYYNAILDNSFVDDLEADLWYGKTGDRGVLYYDYPDGAGRFGLGTLAHCWEDNIFGLGMVDGIGLGGRAIAIMYDGDSHGTYTAGQIAGRGLTSFPVGLAGSMQTLTGVAPESTVMGVMTVGIASEFISMLWAAGFDFDGDYFTWDYESAHQMHITSNSWGWVAPQYYELWGQYSLIYAAIATPGYFNATHYPGLIQCFSAGNSGPGYGTTTPPRAPNMIGVGATTSYHTFQNSYGPDQGFDQIASFSSRGPLTLGYPKPDILAPGANNYLLAPMYGDLFFGTSGGYTINGGTSMACPIVAGAAALIIDAYVTAHAALPAPDYVKTVLESTADDIGMDPLAQGHGRVNITSAIDYVEGDAGVMWQTTDSIDYWGSAMADAWSYHMEPYDRMAFINETVPTGFADGNLYYGLVAPGSEYPLTFSGTTAAGAPVVAADYTWQATRYELGDVWTFSYETSIYNETTSTGYDSTKGGYFVLETELEAAETGAWTTFQNAMYATIHITGDYDTFQGDTLWAFIFDWDDTDPANGVPDYYNTTYDTGDELTRWQYGGGTANTIKMDLSHPDGLGELFPNAGIVMVHDDTIWDWPYTGGNTLTVTITTWVEVVDTQMALADNPAGGIWANLTVDPSADYGIHQGFIKVTDGGELVHKIPYTYNVYAEYNAHDGTVLELANGAGTDTTPYDPAWVNAGWDTYYTARSGDHGSYVVDVQDAGIGFLCARVSWTSADTDVDIAIVDSEGFALADSGDAVKATDTSSVAIAEITGTGMYIFYTTVNSVAGLPEDIVVEIFGYDTIPEPTLDFSYSARDVGYTPLDAGGSAVGDHVLLNATWIDPVGGIPELTVTSVEMKVLYGVLVERHGTLVIPPGDPGSQFTGTIDPAFYAWELVEGITEGDNVRVNLDFSNGDCDLMVWWADTPMESRSYANNLMGGVMATGAHPEIGSFTADRDGDLEFGILNYDGAAGTYDLSVDTRLGLEPARVYTNNFQIDTYYLLANQTYSVLVDSDTGVNIRYSLEFSDIFIGNFFAPVVTVNAPVDQGDNVWRFSWSSTDRNADDVNYYSVWLSGDGGISYNVLARNLTVLQYDWDSTGFLQKEYICRVRAFSLDMTTTVDGWPAGGVSEDTYWPGDFSDGFSDPFTAGDVPTTTTSTGTGTGTGPTGTGQPLDPLLVGLIGGIGVGVVVILILFLIKKR